MARTSAPWAPPARKDSNTMADVIAPVSEPTVTLVEGTCFAISATTGEIVPGGVNGLYCQDSRMLSAWRLLLDGRAPEPLSVHLDTPFQVPLAPPRPGCNACCRAAKARRRGDARGHRVAQPRYRGHLLPA